MRNAKGSLVRPAPFPRDASSPVVTPLSPSVVYASETPDALDDQYEGATLIHVRHADPNSFDRHYGLLIQRMLHGKSLQQISHQTEGIVLHRLHVQETPNRDLVREQVDRLRSPRRATRSSAERQLLSWGTPVVATLHSIPKRELDAEQQARIRAITQRLRPRVEDTPASLAKLFADDRTYWSAIAARLDGNQLVMVNRHLEQLGAQPITMQNKPVERIAVAGD